MIDEQRVRPADWHLLTSEEKRHWRFECWRDSAQDVEFASPEAEASYKARIERFIAAYNLREPDRVPVSIPIGNLPLREAGITYRAAAYHPEMLVSAIEKFNREHGEELEALTSSAFSRLPARALDILDNKMYAYPGRGMPEDAVGFQFVEGEYMRSDEYDALITDPSDFWLRTFFPRAYGIFEPFAQLDPLTSVVEMVNIPLWPLAQPDMQAALRRLLEAGEQLARYEHAASIQQRQTEALGHPPTVPSCFAKAPFDTLGDTLRGTRGILTDMLRQPDKLLAALEVIANFTIRSILCSPVAARRVAVTFPLHKGADGWMSEEQFLMFYWPSLRKVIDAMIDEGMLVCLFAEGSYNTRLDLLNVFPRGAVSWHFDRTDMAKAKRLLGADCSLEGNIPSSLLVAGSAAEVRAECRRLIEICAPGGGYILSAGASPEFPRLENLKAMVETAREYGVYQR
jgi:uroporphyrinogen-III decarboxylase